MLQSKGSERVGHDLATEQQQQQMRGGGQVGSGSRPAQGQSDGGRNQEHALPGRKVTPKGKEQNEEIHPHGKWSSVKISGDLVWEKRERRGKEGEGEGWKKEKKKATEQRDNTISCHQRKPGLTHPQPFTLGIATHTCCTNAEQGQVKAV